MLSSQSLKSLTINALQQHWAICVNFIFVTFLMFVLWKSAVLLPITIACEILAKCLLGHVMEKWVLRLKQKVIQN